MQLSQKIFAPRGQKLAIAFILPIACALVLQAQSAPPAADGPSTAALDQDVQSLQRVVNELKDRVDLLTTQNEQLRKQVLTPEEIKTLIQSGVQNAIAKSRSDIGTDVSKSMDSANENLRKQIMAEVAKQIQALAEDTDTQLKKLAKAIGEKPVVTSVSPSTPIKPVVLPPGTQGVQYKVQNGDSIAKIAKQNGISMAYLLAANPQIADPGKVKVGDTILIPLKDGPTVAPVPPAR